MPREFLRLVFQVGQVFRSFAFQNFWRMPRLKATYRCHDSHGQNHKRPNDMRRGNIRQTPPPSTRPHARRTSAHKFSLMPVNMSQKDQPTQLAELLKPVGHPAACRACQQKRLGGRRRRCRWAFIAHQGNQPSLIPDRNIIKFSHRLSTHKKPHISKNKAVITKRERHPCHAMISPRNNS